MIASEAEGKNIHMAIVIGIKAININTYPLIKKLEIDKKIKPISKNITHNMNLKDDFLFLNI